ncbi:MAG: hypothetical protein OXE99_03790, partial [Cellvibrionales bacterium]|nr:hypothetical protein [Cellvibrionales bacterium]
ANIDLDLGDLSSGSKKLSVSVVAVDDEAADSDFVIVENIKKLETDSGSDSDFVIVENINNLETDSASDVSNNDVNKLNNFEEYDIIEIDDINKAIDAEQTTKKPSMIESPDFEKIQNNGASGGTSKPTPKPRR